MLVMMNHFMGRFLQSCTAYIKIYKPHEIEWPNKSCPCLLNLMNSSLHNHASMKFMALSSSHQDKQTAPWDPTHFQSFRVSAVGPTPFGPLSMYILISVPTQCQQPKLHMFVGGKGKASHNNVCLPFLAFWFVL